MPRVSFNSVNSDHAVGSDAKIQELGTRWGISPGYWLWGPPVRILFVVDGRINIGKDPFQFGLGYVLETLRDPAFAWWIRFRVDVANRDREFESPADHIIVTDADGNKYYGAFRFTQDAFSLDDYDQVWFFGDNPGFESDQTGVGDEVINETKHTPLDDAELKLLAEWMDRGGGVFATGDHGLLGASLCSRIPRVRTMRKWTHAQGVPPKTGEGRLQTLTPTSASADVEEGDELPQRIQPVYQGLAITSVTAFGRIPHPLLCGSSGVLDEFPDHMHEGELIADEDVDLTRPLNIPGYSRPEYPLEPLVLDPHVEEGAAAPALQPFRHRPQPRVIAHGVTTNAPTRVFPLISVYDGDRAEIGRVVVDSTWHHWFSMNLHGFVTSAPGRYRRMQEYYRNVGLWLATPAKRASMLTAAIWGVLNGSPPMTFQGDVGPWENGRVVLQILGRTALHCVRHDWVNAVLGPKASTLSAVPSNLPDAEPCWSCVPMELIERAVVGSIATAMLDLTWEHQTARIRGQRPRLNPERIGRRAAEGIAASHRLLLDSLANAAAAAAERQQHLATVLRPPVAGTIDVALRLTLLRVVLERLQFPDVADPDLVESSLTLIAQVLLDGSVVAARRLEGVAVPSFDSRNGVVDLDLVIGEIATQEGEELTLRLSSATADPTDVRRVRFVDRLTGEPSRWVGKHRPGRDQLWWLWYRIEHIAGDSTLNHKNA